MFYIGDPLDCLIAKGETKQAWRNGDITKCFWISIKKINSAAIVQLFCRVPEAYKRSRQSA
jgi:hypothetical protein